MAFQWVFDKAETLSINRRPNVASTTSRSNVIRTTNLGGGTWRFEVKLPDGLPWTQLRPLIEELEAYDRFTVDTIQINHPGHTWINQYQGQIDVNALCLVTYPSELTPTKLLLSTDPGNSGNIALKSGDWIQLQNTSTAARYNVYSVVSPTTIMGISSSSQEIYVNRPIIEPVGSSYKVVTGQDILWKVQMAEFPQWTIFQYNQVSWSGPFVFYEVLQ